MAAHFQQNNNSHSVDDNHTHLSTQTNENKSSTSENKNRNRDGAVLRTHHLLHQRIRNQHKYQEKWQSSPITKNAITIPLNTPISFSNKNLKNAANQFQAVPTCPPADYAAGSDADRLKTQGPGAKTNGKNDMITFKCERATAQVKRIVENQQKPRNTRSILDDRKSNATSTTFRPHESQIIGAQPPGLSRVLTEKDPLSSPEHVSLVAVVIFAIVLLFCLRNRLPKRRSSVGERSSIVGPSAAYKMDNKDFRKTLENCRSAVHAADQNPATEDIATALRNLFLNANNCSLGGVEMVRKSAAPPSNQIQIMIEDQHSPIGPSSSNAEAAAAPATALDHSTATIAQRRQRSQSPRRSARFVTADELTIVGLSRPSTPIPPTAQMFAPLTIVCGQGQSTAGRQSNRGSPKIDCSNDDKENESPIAASAGDMISSPKNKLSENILAQQNSPRFADAGATRFSFSPKQVYSNEGAGVATTSRSAAVASASKINSSPLLSSAVYKHGNYFKFPEVDCFTPDKSPANAGRPAPQTIPAAAGTKSSQAMRRARLKSISLDSEGARLVEDNLGVPVAELIANQSPPDESFHCGGQEDTDSDRTPYITKIASLASSNLKRKRPRRRKNKNNLTIQIDSELPPLAAAASLDEDGSTPPASQPPKTPTLTQTKQKAVSLDSSDAGNFLYVQTSSSAASTASHGPSKQPDYYQCGQLFPVAPISLIRISSSVPNTPRRMMVGSRKKLGDPKSFKIPTRQRNVVLAALSLLDNNMNQDAVNVRKMAASLSQGGLGHGDAPEAAEEPDERDCIKLATAEKQHKATDYQLLGSDLQGQTYTTLSLSNNNLKTLPEVMTLSDFSTFNLPDVANPGIPYHQYYQLQQQHQADTASKSNVTKSMVPVRSNILQRRGSNHSLTLNLNGSLGNLTKSLSVSNYSLGSFSGSNYNLSHQSQHQMHSAMSSTQSIVGRGSQTNIMLSRPSKVQQQQVNATSDAANANGDGNKKNLLQRRGSNTSLTLNLTGSSYANLSRFNSHSSLNIASMNLVHQSQSATVGGASVKFKQQQQQQVRPPQPQTPQQQPQTHGKKGLLERRSSNASLTLNIESRGLSTSASSLNSITNPTEYYDPSAIVDLATTGGQPPTSGGGPGSKQQRKFLSSENLSTVSQCSKLNQTHARNATKTCFGSVSDLKPNQLINQPPPQPANADFQPYYGTAENRPQFEQTTLCSCTGVRNITTKPLSPQSTSEDFKMYLANIQLLQNATNLLTDEHLRKLHFIFQRSYQSAKQPPPVPTTTTTDDDDEPTSDDDCRKPPNALRHFIFNVSPSYDEQKHLLRSLHAEFWDLPTNHQEKPFVFGSQAKNRYKTILPNEHSRVILDMETESLHEPYINANYVKGPDYTQNSYIATQGPLPNTIYDFWLMVEQNMTRYEQQQDDSPGWQHGGHCDSSAQVTTSSSSSKMFSSSSDRRGRPPHPNRWTTSFSKCQKIVMLTNFVENNQQKCSIYFPIEANATIFITAQNEKFENERLAASYEPFFADDHFENGDGCNGCDRFDFELEGDRGEDDVAPPNQNYFLVKNCDIRFKNGFSIRKLVCLYVCGRPGLPDDRFVALQRRQQLLRRFVCYHYWFPDWPDHRSPSDVTVLLNMCLHLLDGEFPDDDDDDTELEVGDHFVNVNEHMLETIAQQNDNGSTEPLPIIHCSAGIGRTGCLAAILNGLRQIRASIQQILEPWNYQLTSHSLDVIRTKQNYVSVDVLGIVCNLRLQRGGMVQNSEQYELIHRALCLYQTQIDEQLLNWDRKIIEQGVDDESDDYGTDEIDRTTVI